MSPFCVILAQRIQLVCNASKKFYLKDSNSNVQDKHLILKGSLFLDTLYIFVITARAGKMSFDQIEITDTSQ